VSSYERKRIAGMHNRVLFIKGAEYRAAVRVVKLGVMRTKVELGRQSLWPILLVSYEQSPNISCRNIAVVINCGPLLNLVPQCYCLINFGRVLLPPDRF
jgi:hypothetical protein